MSKRIPIYIILGVIILAGLIYFVPSVRTSILPRNSQTESEPPGKYVHNPEFDKCVNDGGKVMPAIVGDNPLLKSTSLCQIHDQTVQADILASY